MKNYYFIGLFSIVSLFVNAQILKVHDVLSEIGYNDYLGIELGMGSGSMNVANPDVNNKLVYKAGLYFDFYVPESKVLLETGLYYEAKGAVMNGFLPVYADYVKNIDLDLSYLTVPLMIHLNPTIISKEKKIFILYKIGAYYSLGLKGKALITGINENGTIFNQKIPNAFKENHFPVSGVDYDFEPFKSYDIGPTGGVDVVFNRISFRTNFSFSGIKLHPTYDKKMNNLSWMFSLGYKLF
jgi:hypothetical protein